jgi:hypothetical protein
MRRVRKNRTLPQFWANQPPRFGAKKHQSGSGSASSRRSRASRGEVVGESGVGLSNGWDWLEHS